LHKSDVQDLGNSSKSSPLKHGSFFKSFRGRSAWDVDDDEFDGARKYSIETEEASPEEESMGEHSASLEVEQSAAQFGTQDESKLSTSSNLHGGSFFKSFRGRSPFDADDDEFDAGRKYSTAILDTDEVSQPPTPFLSPSKIRSPRLSSPYPLPRPSPSAEIEEEETSTKLQSGDYFKSFRGRSPFDADDDEFDNTRRYTTETSSSPSPTSILTANRRPKHNRKISWADQLAKTNSNSNPAPSHDTSEQAALGSKGDAASAVTSTSTSDNFPLNLPAHLHALKLDPYKTIRRAEGKLMSSTLSAARDISPFKGNMWDPEEDEWAEMDTNKVVETFQASYKSPVPRSPTKASAMSYFGTAFQQTVKSVLVSPRKKAVEEKIQEEERVRDKIEELENTWYCDPDGDANDEVMKGVFLSPSRFFPHQQPDSARNMHIIDIDSYFDGEDPLVKHAYPRLCDAVATVLSHTSKDCLEAFLNPSVKELIYRREIDRNKGGLILIIRRTGNEVHCGAYVTFGFMKQWKLYVKSLIGVTGQWYEVYATLKPGIMPIENGVVEWGTVKSNLVESGEKREVLGSADEPRKLDLSPSKKISNSSDAASETNPKFMLYQGRFLARWLLWDMWYRFDKRSDCKAVWEADGVATDVRLKRALVGADDEDDE
tara:strand:- start:559 stop:2529 length:1971 start_codon:yes stop_codon:yes gene_type:complete